MTTNTTPSQAASIDKPEFIKLLDDYAHDATMGYEEAYARILSYIEPKILQAREEATGRLAIAFEKMLCAAIGRDWSAAGISASSLVNDLRNRTIAAESRLAEIQRGLHGLERYGFDGKFGGDFGGDPLGPFVKIDEVRALLQPPSQSDTNGLPG